MGSTHSSQCLSRPPRAAGAALQPCCVGAAASSHCPLWRPCCADGPKGPLRRQIFALCRPFRCSDFSFLLRFTARPCGTEGPPGAAPFGCSRGPKRDKFGAVQEPAFCGAEHPRPSFPSPPLFPSWSFLLAPSAFAPRAQQPGGPQGAVMPVGLSAPTLRGVNHGAVRRARLIAGADLRIHGVRLAGLQPPLLFFSPSSPHPPSTAANNQEQRV